MTRLSNQTIKENLVSLTRDLMLVPTTTSRPDEIARGLQLIKNHLETLKHIKIAHHQRNGHPSLVVTPNGVEKPEILICAHIDVVDYPSVSAFQSRIQDGRIIGPGAGDMKGSLAIGLDLFHRFQSRAPGLSLGFVVTSDEELGGADGMGYLVQERNIRCAMALVPDGGSLNSVTTHEKGVLHLRVKCRGRFSHASRPWEGDNALARLIKNLRRVETLFGEMKTEDNWMPTCSPTLIKTSNDVINRIPDDAEAGLDIRFPQPYTSADILSKMRDAADEGFEIEELIKAEPSEFKPDPLYLTITEELTGRPVKKVRDHGGSDARYLAAIGIPVIIARPLVGLLHSQEEWIDIDSMVMLYRIYERYITKKLSL